MKYRIKKLVVCFLAVTLLPAAAQMRGGGFARSSVSVATPRMGMARGGGFFVPAGPMAPRTGGMIFGSSPVFVNGQLFVHGRHPFPRICVGDPLLCSPFFKLSGFNPFFTKFNPFFGGFNPFFGSGFVGPWWGGWWSGAGWPPADYYSSDSSAQLQATMAQQGQLISELEDQVRQERLRRMAAESERPVPSPPAAPPAPSKAATPEPAMPPTVLVFRDGSRTEVRNYAIVGNTLYEYGPHWTKKISLTQLDVPATVSANEQRGIEFHLPATAKR
jgi:hypothetical protein